MKLPEPGALARIFWENAQSICTKDKMDEIWLSIELELDCNPSDIQTEQPLNSLKKCNSPLDTPAYVYGDCRN